MLRPESQTIPPFSRKGTEVEIVSIHEVQDQIRSRLVKSEAGERGTDTNVDV
jgi:hypothetical protein